MKRLILALLILALTFAADPATAAVKLSRAFGNHMVLQQDQPIRLFGSAKPGEKVTAELAGKTATATTGQNGRFRLELPAMKADGKSHTLTVKGRNTITLKDVLLGEVWICSGNRTWSGAWPARSMPKKKSPPQITHKSGSSTCRATSRDPYQRMTHVDHGNFVRQIRFVVSRRWVISLVVPCRKNSTCRSGWSAPTGAVPASSPGHHQSDSAKSRN